MGKGYKFIDHTADIGVEVSAGNLKELFVNSAMGMFEILGDPSGFEPLERRDIQLAANDVEELMHRWLSFLLYLFDKDKIFLTNFDVSVIDTKSLLGTASGMSYVNKEGALKREIKAITHHQLQIKKVGTRWHAQIIFDI
jgi:SHS2 domain-containing protein